MRAYSYKEQPTMIGVVLNIAAILGLAIAGFGVFVIVQAISRNDSARGGVLLTLIGLVIAIVFFIMSAGVVEIQPNEVGVVFNVLSGELSEDPLGSGIHIIIPGVQEVTIYSIAQQEYTMSGKESEGAVSGDDAVEALTSDGQSIRLEVTILFRINPADAEIVHREWQNRYAQGLIRPTVRSVTREVIGQFEVQEIYSEKRGALGPEIEAQVQEKIGSQGLQVTDVLVRNIEFSQEYVDSIEQKQVAQQQALEAEFRVLEKQQEAEQLKALAEGDKQASITRAQGEAEALRLINEQLSANPALIQWRYIENLSDNVQIILLPSNSPFLFDIQSLVDQAGGQIIVPSTETEEDQGGS
jgi:regulator of protease activity HflC (stomatin/prohibitin superfamily)